MDSFATYQKLAYKSCTQPKTGSILQPSVERIKRMAMRETVRSLRAYFILSGVVSLVSSTSALRVSLMGPATIAAIPAAISVVFSVTFLYVGLSLAGLLRTSVGQIITLLYASTGWSVLIFLLSLLQGLDPVRLGVLILALLILWYLLVNVRRLAAEAQTASALVADSPK